MRTRALLGAGIALLVGACDQGQQAGSRNGVGPEVILVLVCVGQRTYQYSTSPEVETRRYRFSVSRKRWLPYAESTASVPVQMSEKEIVYDDTYDVAEQPGAPAARVTHSFRIDRVTGGIEEFYTSVRKGVVAGRDLTTKEKFVGECIRGSDARKF
jgi:hypothetical protein